MYQVIVCTVSNGRVQRISFDNWDAAQKCADEWSAKNVRRRTYVVSVERVEQLPKWKAAGRTIAA